MRVLFQQIPQPNHLFSFQVYWRNFWAPLPLTPSFLRCIQLIAHVSSSIMGGMRRTCYYPTYIPYVVKECLYVPTPSAMPLGSNEQAPQKPAKKNVIYSSNNLSTRLCPLIINIFSHTDLGKRIVIVMIFRLFKNRRRCSSSALSSSSSSESSIAMT